VAKRPRDAQEEVVSSLSAFSSVGRQKQFWVIKSFLCIVSSIRNNNVIIIIIIIDDAGLFVVVLRVFRFSPHPFLPVVVYIHPFDVKVVTILIIFIIARIIIIRRRRRRRRTRGGRSNDRQSAEMIGSAENVREAKRDSGDDERFHRRVVFET
jgi:membrane protein implicated in regulation of membrane protease activity